MKNFQKIFLIAIFLVALIGLNSPIAKAATIEDLQAQIQSLLVQIAQLQRQLAEIRGEEVWCHDFHLNLKFGMAGTGVRALQTALEKQGFYERVINSTFDEYTASAIVGFQEKYTSEILAPWGLKHGTGYVGSTTRAKLNAIYGCKIPVVPITPSITVLSPNGGETLIDGNTYTISWQSINAPSGSTVGLQIMGIINGSESWGYGLNRGYGLTSPPNLPSTGSFSFIARTAPSNTDFKIRATLFAAGATHYNSPQLAIDASDNSFKIIMPAGITRFIKVVSPNGGENLETGKTHQIKWTSSGIDLTAKIEIRYKSVSAPSEVGGPLITVTTNTGSYNWTIPSNITSSQYLIEMYYVTEYGIFGASDTSDAPFSIVTPSVKPVVGIASPNTGEQWQMGSTYTIRWFADKFSTTDKINIILLDARAGYSYYTIVKDISAYNNSSLGVGTPMGSYSWTIPTIGIVPGSTNSFKIYIGKYNPPSQSGDWEPLRASAESGVYGYGNNFSIVSVSAAPIINDIRPSSILQGQTLQVTLYGYNLGGASNTNGSCGLNPDALGGFVLSNCNIQPLFVSVGITAANNAITGDRQFTITTPSGISNPVKFTVLSSSINRNITVTSPNGGEIWKTGETHRVTWTSQGIDKVAIYVYNDTISGSGSTNYLNYPTTSLSVPASQGYFDWTIKQNMLPGYGLGGSGDTSRYKIRIDDVNVDTTGVRDSSNNYFSIVAATTSCTDSDGGKNYSVRGTVTENGKSYTDYCQGAFYLKEYSCLLASSIDLSGVAEEDVVCPNSGSCINGACTKEEKSITVLSPNGGKVWKIGETQNITWSATGYDSNAPVQISLYEQTSPTTNTQENIAFTTNTGSYSWTIPSKLGVMNLGKGNIYKIIVYVGKTGTANLLFDQSDNYFSIVAKAQPASCVELNNTITSAWHSKCGDSNYDSRVDFVRENFVKGVDCYIDVWDLMEFGDHADDETWCSEKLGGIGLKNIESQLASISNAISELMKRIKDWMK